MLSGIRLMNTNGPVDRQVSIYASGGQGYFLKNVDGLGPPQAEISSTGYSVLDGGVFNNARQPTRNVVIDLGVEPDYANLQTVQEMRRLLYIVAGPKKEVRIDLFDEGSWVMYIRGHVESLEPNIFSKEPSYQISIVCLDPDFLAPSSTTLTGTSGDGQPFVIEYDGDVNAGFTTSITARQSLSYLELRDLITGNTFRVTSPISSGEYFSIISSDKNRRVDHRRSNGSLIGRVISGIDSGSEWPTLRYGTNRFSIHPAVTPASDVTVSYRERYGGF